MASRSSKQAIMVRRGGWGVYIAGVFEVLGVILDRKIMPGCLSMGYFRR